MTVGGVLVRPGDVVVADGDGVVVVPRERAEEVANASLPFLDNITARAVHQGDGPQSVGKKPAAEARCRQQSPSAHGGGVVAGGIEVRVKVGFIGLGAMGLPMAKRVVGAGHETFTVVAPRRGTGR